jgi:hypothetical protein
MTQILDIIEQVKLNKVEILLVNKYEGKKRYIIQTRLEQLGIIYLMKNSRKGYKLVLD